jgi:hypothetical protein
MPFEVKLPPLVEQIATLLIDKKIIPALPKGVKAIATMHPGDEYDEKTGLKVAMAKAEIDAYTIVNNWLVDINDLLIYKIYDKVGDFVDKAEIVINHDVNFVRKF